MGINLNCTYCNSFAQWGIDNLGNDFLDKYWDYDKNIGIDPWLISKATNNKVWIKCLNKSYHKSYLISCHNFFAGKRCPYCNSKKIHPKDSFAQYHIDNTDSDFLNKYWGSNNTVNPFSISYSSSNFVWIKCQEKNYHGEYKIRTICFLNGQRCGYCGNHKVHYLDSLGHLFPKSIELWSSKNTKTPYEYFSGSDKQVLWKCENSKHHDYLRSPAVASKLEFRCPECSRERYESFLQEKVRIYLSENYDFTINHEHNCTIKPVNPRTNYPLPFDNEIEELKLIIEVNGIQHYDKHTYDFWKRTSDTSAYQLKYQRIKDRYKRIIAHINGYHYLEIPYWTEKDESYKILLDEKIKELI